MYCYNCDTRNPDVAHFCVICGKPLAVVAAPAPIKTQAAATTAGYAPAMPATFGPALAPGGGDVTVVQHIYVNGGQPQVFGAQPGVNLLVRAIWFLFVGLWLGQLWLVLAWLFNLTVVGLPLGVWMLNRLPQVMTLRAQSAQLSATQGSGGLMLRHADGPSFAVRAVYFVLIGWWLSLLWLQLAWLFAASLIGLPLAFLMFERTDSVTTLGSS